MFNGTKKYKNANPVVAITFRESDEAQRLGSFIINVQAEVSVGHGSRVFQKRLSVDVSSGRFRFREEGGG